MSDIIKIKLNKNSKNLLLDRNAFFCPNNTLFFNKKIIYQLQTVGREKKENVRVCLHSDKDDELHEMIIYQQKNNFYPPKMHINKTKSFLIVEGELVIGLFDNYGKISKTINLSPRGNIFCRIPSKVFHVDIPIIDSVHLETTLGPFKVSDNVIAPWYDDNERDSFLFEILNN